MTGRPGSRALLGAAFVAAVLASALRLGVDAELLLWLAPAVLLVAPLIMGRFMGEDVIDARRAARATPRRRRGATAISAPYRAPDVAGHRGLLLAFRLAERGPPASLLVA
ncbi:hypothetical protein [Baekduia sp.]|jgi:hypothetical protein|uniref:hypothetical protein n=1 Tax=Baekduia sp. TaxID=2600305 RepID=UPI002DFC9DBC|nr:hypothetical protein [Baekduia sp.]